MATHGIKRVRRCDTCHPVIRGETLQEWSVVAEGWHCEMCGGWNKDDRIDAGGVMFLAVMFMAMVAGFAGGWIARLVVYS